MPAAAGATAHAAAVDAPAIVAGQVPDSDSAAVLFLTIVGDQIHYHWGRAGDRPPRIDQLASPSGETAAAGTLSDDTGIAQSAATSAPETDGSPAERPLGPAPQECPRTLPPGSDQSTADGLWASSRCRYLSSCTLENECTWHYQGRG